MNNAARPDAFGPIHKAIRFRMVNALNALGRADFTDEASTKAALAELRAVLAFCTNHLGHEERFVVPALAERMKSPLATFSDGHPQHERLVAEVEALAAAVEAAPDADARAAAGRSLYLHYTLFFAENCVHMREEEQLVQQLFDKHFSPQEQFGIQQQILGAMTPAERADGVRWILLASSRSERAAMLGMMAKGAPPPAIRAILDLVQPSLSADDYAHLAAAAAPAAPAPAAPAPATA